MWIEVFTVFTHIDVIMLRVWPQYWWQVIHCLLTKREINSLEFLVSHWFWFQSYHRLKDSQSETLAVTPTQPLPPCPRAVLDCSLISFRSLLYLGHSLEWNDYLLCPQLFPIIWWEMSGWKVFSCCCCWWWEWGVRKLDRSVCLG